MVCDKKCAVWKMVCDKVLWERWYVEDAEEEGRSRNREVQI